MQVQIIEFDEILMEVVSDDALEGKAGKFEYGAISADVGYSYC
jgi:hypothetical protein